jgi:crotonobetainyl-CoA:carnitine CoA-transferase CaiB-like acyl-CoA transferase
MTLPPTNGAAGPLAGIRVIDFTWVWSGPMTTYMLADLGAEVIKIEHADRLDNARLRGAPLRDGRPVEGPPTEISPYFHQNNRGKLSVAVDMKRPEGAALVARLVDHADIMVENLSPGALERLGLAWPDVSKRNPGLIALSMSAAGQGGPLRSMKAYAPIMTSLSGLEGLVGYEDDPVVGMMTLGFGDANAASHAIVSVLAALIGRETTGRGTFIDMSQIEAMVSVLAEPVTAYQLTGQAPAAGTSHGTFAPHGHFACRGDDQWIAIAVGSDEEWVALAAVLTLEDALTDRFASAEQRRRHRRELDEALSSATACRDRRTLFDALREAGVRAAPVLSLEEMQVDEHLGERGLLQSHAHPITGAGDLVTVPWHMSATSPTIRSHAPLVGQHTTEVLSRVLGMDAEEISELDASGVLR